MDSYYISTLQGPRKKEEEDRLANDNEFYTKYFKVEAILNFEVILKYELGPIRRLQYELDNIMS